MAKNDANKEGIIFREPRGELKTVSVLGTTVVTGGKRPVDYSTHTSPSIWDVPYPGEVRTGVIRSVPNMKPR